MSVVDLVRLIVFRLITEREFGETERGLTSGPQRQDRRRAPSKCAHDHEYTYLASVVTCTMYSMVQNGEQAMLLTPAPRSRPSLQA